MREGDDRNAEDLADVDEDLELDGEAAEAVRGGKVNIGDISITKPIDKSSPTLYQGGNK